MLNFRWEDFANHCRKFELRNVLVRLVFGFELKLR